MRITKYLGITGWFVLLPTRVSAVQHHGGLEGLVSHVIGHLLFMAGIIIFLVWIRSYHDRGWHAFKNCLGSLLAWNFLTLSGHLLYEFQEPARFIKTDGKIIAYSPETLLDFYFYLTRLDHFLLVPAFVFLLAALIKWRDNGDTHTPRAMEMPPRSATEQEQ